MAADDLVTWLVQLLASPADSEADELRRKCADALEQRGEAALAARLLAPLVNLTSHDESGPLPCLCKRCAAAAPPTATSGEVAFHRTFAVAGTRVLWFWLPEELLADRLEVKRAVAADLRSKLRRRARGVAAA